MPALPFSTLEDLPVELQGDLLQMRLARQVQVDLDVPRRLSAGLVVFAARTPLLAAGVEVTVVEK